MSREDQIDNMSYELMLTGKSLDTVYPDDCEKIAAVLYDAGYRKQSEWISVEERLPVPYADVIVYDKTSGVIMDSMLSTGEFVNGLVVTHWMPLPEPPKMRKEDEGK